MAISFSKGGNISLTKTDPQLKYIHVGLSWDARSTDGSDFGVFMVKDDNEVRSEQDFIFYNQSKSTCSSVEHIGDNRAGVRDDEAIKVALESAQRYRKNRHAVTIHNTESSRQNFGQVNNAVIRLVIMDTNNEVTR